MLQVFAGLAVVGVAARMSRRRGRRIDGLGDMDLLNRYVIASKDLHEERREGSAAVNALVRLERRRQKDLDMERDVSRDQQILDNETHRSACFRIKQSAMDMRDTYQDVRKVTGDSGWGQTVRDIETCSGPHKSDCDEDSMMLNSARNEIDNAHGSVGFFRKSYEKYGCASVAGPASSIPTSLFGLKRSGGMR